MIPPGLSTVLLLAACKAARHPGADTGLHPDSFRDTGRDTARDTGQPSLEGTAYFPLATGWSWTYNAQDGGFEHRATSGLGSLDGTEAWGVRESQTGADGTGELDVSTVYFTQDATGVSIVGSQHADSGYPDATDTITYDPPLFYVPADPAAMPTFSTVGTVHLVVADADGVIQDTTIDWSLAGSAAPATFVTPAGTFDGYAITYTPGGALGYARGVGLVDMGSGRLLQEWGEP